MTRLEVLEYPDPRLKLKSRPVTRFDDALRRLVDDLVDTMRAADHCIGLSAPQVGDPRQVLVIDLPRDDTGPHVYVNPEITARALFGIVEESCLSVPGVEVKVFRATQVRVQAQDVHGEPFVREVDKLHAVCLQHEIDHFRGKLLVDRMSFISRWRFKRQHLASA